MDIQSQRPAVGSSALGRPDSVPYREAIRTELPSSQTVTATQASNESGKAAPDQQPVPPEVANRQARLQRVADTIREDLQRRIETDSNAGTLVFRTVDTRTGEVVRQYPDDMVLKLKAYAREMRRREEEVAQEKSGSNSGVERVA